MKFLGMVKLNKYTLRKMGQKRNQIGKKSKVIYSRYGVILEGTADKTVRAKVIQLAYLCRSSSQ